MGRRDLSSTTWAAAGVRGGHGTIGLVVTLAPGPHRAGRHGIETPVGNGARATLHEDGSVSVRNAGLPLAADAGHAADRSEVAGDILGWQPGSSCAATRPGTGTHQRLTAYARRLEGRAARPGLRGRRRAGVTASSSSGPTGPRCPQLRALPWWRVRPLACDARSTSAELACHGGARGPGTGPALAPGQQRWRQCWDEGIALTCETVIASCPPSRHYLPLWRPSTLLD